MDVTWLGGSCVRLHAGGVSVLTDSFDLHLPGGTLSADVVTLSLREARDRLPAAGSYRLGGGRAGRRRAEFRLFHPTGWRDRLPPGTPEPAAVGAGSPGDGRARRAVRAPRRAARSLRAARGGRGQPARGQAP